MGNQRRKRNRNKSSPQTDLSPKKHRKQPIVDGDRRKSKTVATTVVTSQTPPVSPTARQCTNDRSDPADSLKLSSMADSMDSTVAGHGSIQDDAIVNPGGGEASHDTLQLQYNQITGPLPPPLPPVFNSPMNTMHPSFGQPMFQSPGHMPHYAAEVKLTDSDIMKIAMQTQYLMRQELEEMVNVKVAMAIQPLQQQINNVQSELNATKANLEQLQQSVLAANIKNDDLEQYSRRSCLRISGIPEEQHEDVHAIVLELAEQIGADIKPEDIDRAHRVGKYQTCQPNDKRNTNDRGSENVVTEPLPKGPLRGREIIVKFQSHRARLNFLKERTKLKQATLKMYINEDLTITRKNLAFTCRQLKRDEKIKKTWVYGGNVYIRDLKDTDLCIKTDKDLEAYSPKPRKGQPGEPQSTVQPTA